MTPQRGVTASGITTMTGGPSNGDVDVKVPAVRATHCRRQILPGEAAIVGRGG